ncbi:hypothetical protein OSB04_018898 [Centaurea solstitialis]|uniref:Transmembrane protein n=1 Tax=Centaurea solstitialis TaxID=347529 RepID=A0AA38T1I6_9ASTR|nr:hypothetical protein OSB04_018898 [Centaurea solstitialis]
MDRGPLRDPDFVIDLESGAGVSPDLSSDENLPKTDFSKLSDHVMSVDDDLENNVKVVIDSKVEVGKKIGKEKRKKSSSAKKPPKPPRPPRGFSLDAADQKLIKELAELAIIKRARIERMKALKQKKALRASSSSSSMNGSLFAMLFTVIFFLMILLQGMSCRSPGITPQGSPQTNENGLIFTQEQLNPSATDSILPDSKSLNLLEKISGSASGTGISKVAE